jgi:acyl-CoA-binding protein
MKLVTSFILIGAAFSSTPRVDPLIAAITAEFGPLTEMVHKLPREDHLPESERNIKSPQRLEMYSLYKQATVGDCPSEPAKKGPEESLRHRTWEQLRGMDKNDAKVKYVRAFKRIQNELAQRGITAPP